MIRRFAGAVALVTALSAAGACGGSNKVGDKSLLNVQDKINNCRVGECTTTTPAPAAAAATTTTKPGANLGIKPATTQPPTVTTVVREQVITINSDTSGGTSQFDPNSVTVFTNYPVRFQNKDTVARSVVFADRRSPSIEPGKSWTTTFAAAGNFPYQDGTRPYATGSVQVIAR